MKIDTANCVTNARSAEVLPSKRLEQRRERIKQLHAQGHSVASILNLVFGVDVNQVVEPNPFRAIDLSEFSANRLASLEREVLAVITENQLSNDLAKTKPSPPDVGRPRKGR